tara:strand:- start:2317 stop:3012 length:696 start_codon:yes stop_codon:yes gene_type:complete
MSIIRGCLAKIGETLLLYPIHAGIHHQYLHNVSFKSAMIHLKRNKKVYTGVGIRCVHTGVQRILDISIWKRLNETPLSNNDTLNHYIGGNISAISKLALYPIQTAERIKQSRGSRRLKTILRNHKKLLFNGIRYQYLINSFGYTIWWKSYETIENKINSQKIIKNKNVKNLSTGFFSGVVVDLSTHVLHVAKTNLQQNKKLQIGQMFKKGLKFKMLLSGIESSIFNFLWKL